MLHCNTKMLSVSCCAPASSLCSYALVTTGSLWEVRKLPSTACHLFNLNIYLLRLLGTAFTSLILSVFFGTVAGIFRVTTPFRGTHCGRPADFYPVIWRPWFQECSAVVAMEAIAWSLCTYYLSARPRVNPSVSYIHLSLLPGGALSQHDGRHPALHVPNHPAAHAGWVLRLPYPRRAFPRLVDASAMNSCPQPNFDVCGAHPIRDYMKHT